LSAGGTGRKEIDRSWSMNPSREGLIVAGEIEGLQRRDLSPRREVGQRGSDGTDCAISDSPTPFRANGGALHRKLSLGCEPDIPTLRATDGIVALILRRELAAACWSQHVSLHRART